MARLGCVWDALLTLLAIIVLPTLRSRSQSALSLSFVTAYFDQTVNLPDFISPQEDGRYIVLNLSWLGLGNRLISLSDWYVAAVLSGRKLILSWRPSQECNVAFFDLFDDVPEDLIVLPEPLAREDDGILEAEQLIQERNMTYRRFLSSEESQLPAINPATGERYYAFILSKDILFGPEQVLITSYIGSLTVEGVPCQLYSLIKRNFLRSLRPVATLQSTVDSIMFNYFRGYIAVGVHMRVHDGLYDWAVIPPIGGGNTALEFDQAAGVDDFVKIMKRIETHFEVKPPLTSTDDSTKKSFVRFFVASNNMTEKLKLLQHFPTAISLTGDLTRDSKEGMELAFLEWLILTRTSLVIHVYGSSFASVATDLSGVPLVSLIHGQWVHAKDVNNHKFCGNTLYARYYGQTAKSYSFTEGTIDNREISGTLLRTKVCNSLLNWGLDEAVCLE